MTNLIQKLSLLESDYAELAKSGIDRALVDRAGLFRLTSAEGAALIGQKARDRDFSGYVFPYKWPGAPDTRELRLRRDNPDLEQQPDGTKKIRNKYMSPPGRGNILYFSPDAKPEALRDSRVKVVIVEGEKKTLATQAFFGRQSADALVIGIAGVWGFRGKVGIETNGAGRRQTVKGVIADIERINWAGRDVEIIFDTDAEENPKVYAARRALLFELRARKASPRIITMLPLTETGCKGIDDLIGAKGDDVAADWLQVERAKPETEISLAYTDEGMLNRFCQIYDKDFVYVPEWGQWLAWTGQKWEAADGEALFCEALLATSHEFERQEKDNSIDPDKCEKFFARYCSSTAMKSLLYLAQRDMRLRRPSDAFDANKMLLNCTNGTLDLRNGQLRDFERDDLLTQQLSVAFDPFADAPIWRQFLETVIPDPETRDYVQRAAGYSLTGITSEQCLFILYGVGSNGKSTFIEALETIIGPYHTKAATSTFTSTESIALADLARMKNSRFVTVSESDEKTRLSEGLIKSVTGDKMVTAKALYHAPFTYEQLFKVWFCVNDRPIIRGTDDGIWRRPRFIPFETKIADHQKDRKLSHKLNAEKSGILNWLLQGCLAWQRVGLEIPKQIRDATDGYRQEMDTLGRWIEERCELDESYSQLSTELYADYAEWAKKLGEHAVSNTAFGRRLGDRGYQVHKTGYGVKERLGIKLRRI